MASISTVYPTQVDGLAYDASPDSTLSVNLQMIPGHQFKGLKADETIPTVNQTIAAGYVVNIVGLPLRINSGVVLTVNAGALLRVGP